MLRHNNVGLCALVGLCVMVLGCVPWCVIVKCVSWCVLVGLCHGVYLLDCVSYGVYLLYLCHGVAMHRRRKGGGWGGHGRPTFCLVSRRSAGPRDRQTDRPTADETESTQVRMRLRKTSKTRPASTINPGVRAGH